MASRTIRSLCPSAIFLVFSWLGVPTYDVCKLIMACSFWLAGALMYICAHRISKSVLGGARAAIVFALQPGVPLADHGRSLLCDRVCPSASNISTDVPVRGRRERACDGLAAGGLPRLRRERRSPHGADTRHVRDGLYRALLRLGQEGAAPPRISCHRPHHPGPPLCPGPVLIRNEHLQRLLSPERDPYLEQYWPSERSGRPIDRELAPPRSSGPRLVPCGGPRICHGDPGPAHPSTCFYFALL